ncbi:hypothetical protein [Acidithiobacillus sp. HP-11]|uniref:hypothetical protein n=1 Tax=Acidithiobacillus sp. HP-11 TaxID=2697656 RepID=UPI001879C851|nr:hypothetical protein [Acidithiobacillus sp. HP-11]MBE7565751.1 hypothetical protein [Acidithiobacillus sp. HP-11]
MHSLTSGTELGLSPKWSDFSNNWFGSIFTENNSSNPYYVVTPAYTRKSAGIRVLHLLCNSLNKLGYRAHLIIQPQFNFASPVSPFLNTPVLTRAQLINDYQRGLTPIVIYPETIGSNLFNAPVAFEYLLNFGGLLSGAANEHVMPQIAYSEQIRKKSPGCIHTLFIPTSDPRVFYPLKEDVVRQGIYFYAAKFQSLYGKILNHPEPGMIEIFRKGISAQSTKDLIRIYHTAKRIYLYENSAVATEAAMCGCPVVFMPSDFLDANITEFELGSDGMAWGNSKEEIVRAETTVEKFYNHYIEAYNISRSQLEDFVEYSQELASQTDYKEKIKVFHTEFFGQLLRLLSNTYGLAHKVIYKISRG